MLFAAVSSVARGSRRYAIFFFFIVGPGPPLTSLLMLRDVVDVADVADVRDVRDVLRCRCYLAQSNKGCT